MLSLNATQWWKNEKKTESIEFGGIRPYEVG